MSSTRGQLKTTIRTNLNDAGVTFWSEADLNDSLQDAYDDIACLSQCVCKTADNLSWIGDLSYLNFKDDYNILDYLTVVAIFNYSTNRWLRDDLSLRDFDRLRRDWENWIGTPQFWAPSDPLHIAIAPKYNGVVAIPGAFNALAFSNAYFIGSSGGSLGTFKLVYAATAPTFSSDSDSPLTASDVQNLFEFYATADMLEQAQEYTKASEYWEKYYGNITEYTTRVKKNNATDLLLRV